MVYMITLLLTQQQKQILVATSLPVWYTVHGNSTAHIMHLIKKKKIIDFTKNIVELHALLTSTDL